MSDKNKKFNPRYIKKGEAALPQYKNKGKNLSCPMILEVYTPLHIGSGEELKNNYDFIMDNSKPFIVDIKQTLDSIRADDPQLNKYYDRAEIETLVKIAGQKYGYPLPAFSKTLSPPNPGYNPPARGSVREENIKTIREQLKDVFFRPIIPGSSLKGAMRTALWAESLHQSNPCRAKLKERLHEALQNGDKKRKKKIEKKIEQDIFGKDPATDIMRSLHISDGYFETNHLQLGDVRAANVCGHILKWKPLGDNKHNRNNQTQWEKAKGIFIEVLGKGAKAKLIFSWDEFLLSEMSWWKPCDLENQKNLSVKNFQDLKKTLNSHALRISSHENNFFKNYKYPPATEFYRNLKKDIEKDEDSAWLRVGWGNGWTGMTGLTQSLLDLDEMRNLIYKFNRKTPENIYPKTRRLLVQDHSPCLPLAWVKIYPSDNSVQNPYESSGFTSKKHFDYRKREHFSPWLSKQIFEIGKSHNIKSEDEILKGKILAQNWKNLSEGEDKQKVLNEIMDYWEKRGWCKSASGRSLKKAREIYDEGRKK